MNLLRIPQLIVAWMFNIVAIALIFVGVCIRVVAEWIHGDVPKAEEIQEGELTADDLARIIAENYADLGDGGASQEGFEKFLDEQENKDKKVH